MASSTSSSASLPTQHDVFLSFRGEDTRHGFISHLHSALCRKSITTFMDSELRSGEEISQATLNAIEESMFAIVVFSKRYASSRRCLDELAKIVECMDTRGQKIIPVFYHVDPSDVRKQTGTFADAFAGHEANFNSNMEKVQRWRDALTKAANLSGWHTQDCRSESDIVDGIVHRILKDLQEMRPGPFTGLVGTGNQFLGIVKCSWWILMTSFYRVPCKLEATRSSTASNTLLMAFLFTPPLLRLASSKVLLE